MKTKKLLKKVEKIAKAKYGGHYTIYKFTNHYKGCFGTLYDPIRDEISNLKEFKSLKELLTYLIILES